MFSFNSRAQNIPVHYNFDTTLTNNTDSLFIYVKNPLNQEMNISSVRTMTSKFFTKVNSFVIDPLDSLIIWIYFRTNQNISYRDFLVFENAELNYSIVHYLTATGIYPDALYRFTQGLVEEPLKIALKNFCTTNTNNNYTSSRLAMFSTIDDYEMDDTIECVYTGRKVYTTGIPSVNPPQSMNTEHTFPQGFFNENEPMRSDIHHLFPTDEQANSRRANFDFGYVISGITWENGGSKLGNDFEGQVVFEPRTVHKGNVARCLFYFLIRYQNYGGFMDAKQERVLREWNLIDTVGARERIRNNGISAFQNNRSPFVDHPEFIERISSTYSVIPNILKPEISASPFNVIFDTIAVNDTASYYLSLFNYGTGNLNIGSVVSASPQFVIESFPATISQGEFNYVKIKFRPDQLNHTFNSVLTIYNNDSNINVNLTGYSNKTIGITVNSNKIPEEFFLHQNYPNPFNPTTIIQYELPANHHVVLKIYNYLGSEVAILVNEKQSAGSYSVAWDALNYPSGVYFYELRIENLTPSQQIFTQRRKMLLLK